MNKTSYNPIPSNFLIYVLFMEHESTNTNLRVIELDLKAEMATYMESKEKKKGFLQILLLLKNHKGKELQVVPFQVCRAVMWLQNI